MLACILPTLIYSISNGCLDFRTPKHQWINFLIKAPIATIFAFPFRHRRSYMDFIAMLNLRPQSAARYNLALISGGPIFDIRVRPLTEVPERFSTGATPRNAATCSAFLKWLRRVTVPLTVTIIFNCRWHLYAPVAHSVDRLRAARQSFRSW